MKYQENKDCIEACLDCASICNQCAVDCLIEEESEIGKLTTCIRLNLECGMACYAASEMLTLGSEKAVEYCKLCAELCEACERECNKHNYQHCRDCAKACRNCAAECRNMVVHTMVVSWTA